MHSNHVRLASSFGTVSRLGYLFALLAALGTHKIYINNIHIAWEIDAFDEDCG